MGAPVGRTGSEVGRGGARLRHRGRRSLLVVGALLVAQLGAWSFPAASRAAPAPSSAVRAGHGHAARLAGVRSSAD